MKSVAWRFRIAGLSDGLFSAAAIFVWVAGCAVVYPGNFSFPNVQCRMLHGWCVFELPGAADLAIGAGNSGMVDETKISFRLAPRNGIVAAWSSAELTVVDLNNDKSIKLKVLDTREVTGRRLYPHINEDQWVLYGPFSEGQFRLSPRVARMEVRFPSVLLDGRVIQVPPIRIDDGLRVPKIFIYYSH
jgi:hypothetical protein